MTFTPPKRDIVEMMTPSKEPTTSTAITSDRAHGSFLDFFMGGTPQINRTIMGCTILLPV
jgi:hypothetical protein